MNSPIRCFFEGISGRADRGPGRHPLGVHPYAARARRKVRKTMDTRTAPHVDIAEREPLIIRRIDAIPVGLPLRKPVAMAGVTVDRALNLLVRIEAADGTVGWGEAASAPTMTGDTLGGLFAAVRDHLAPLLIGEDAWLRPALCHPLRRALFGNTGAHSAIEMALLDLAGRASGLPLADLIGGAVRFEVAPMWLLGNPTPEAGHRGGAPQARGRFRFLQAQDRHQAGRGRDHSDASAAQRARLRDALVRRRQLRARLRGRPPLPGGRRRGRAHVPRAAARARRPCRPRRARARSPTPIGADEGIHSLADVEAHARCGAGGVSLKLIKLGGMSVAVEAAALCRRLGLSINVAAKIAEFEHRLGGGDPPRLRGAGSRLGREPHPFLSRRGHRH